MARLRVIVARRRGVYGHPASAPFAAKKSPGRNSSEGRHRRGGWMAKGAPLYYHRDVNAAQNILTCFLSKTSTGQRPEAFSHQSNSQTPTLVLLAKGWGSSYAYLLRKRSHQSEPEGLECPCCSLSDFSDEF